jgi:ATP-dependent DNA helicase RecG
VIVLGLDEETGFVATGIRDVSEMLAAISDMCSDTMVPPVRPVVEAHTFEGGDVITIEVAEIPAEQKPCYVKTAGMTNGTYLRVGDSDRRATAYEVQLIVADRGQPRDDEEPVLGTSLHDLDSQLVDAYLKRTEATRPKLANMETQERLAASRIITGDGGEVSLAALLAFGRLPQQHFPQLNLTFVHFVKEDGTTDETGRRFEDNVTIDGPITQIIVDAASAIRRNMARRATVEGIRRTDAWEYPEAAIREAVVNALVHRDLSPPSRGTQVQVEMFPNRLAVRSPGGLHGPVTVDQLGEGVSSSRNATLLRLLEDTPIPGENSAVCENRGSGIRTMLAALRAAGMQPPDFVDRVSAFTVSFPSHALLSNEMLGWISSLGHDGLTESQVIALALMRRGALLDNGKYRKATGVDSRIATLELQDLVGRELAAQHGVKRWAQYSLGVGVDDSRTNGEARAVRKHGPADRRPEILAALGRETLSRVEIVERTGLSDGIVSRWLTALMRDNAIERTTKETQSKHARYRAINPPGQGKLFEDA